MASSGCPRGFGSDPPTESGRAQGSLQPNFDTGTTLPLSSGY